MPKSISAIRIGVKLPAVMTLLVALTIITLTITNVASKKNTVNASANEKLEGIAQLKSKRVISLLEGIEREIYIRANAPSTSQALIALADGYNALENPEEVLRRVYITESEFPLGEKNQLVKADTGSSYGFIHAVYHPSFEALRQQMGYYDVFLFDTEGNLVYSVFKENDFATNILTGKWSESGLGEAFRGAINLTPDDPPAFIDFAPYAPSFMAPAAFISRPVFNEQGTLLGVLAYQMPIEHLNHAANDLEGLGETADGYLVGLDGIMRTDTRRSEVNDILETSVDLDVITHGLAGQKEGSFDVISHTGEDVLGYQIPLEFLGARWVYVLHQDNAELFAGLQRALKIAIIVSVAIFAIALFISILLSRSITRPLQTLTNAVNEVANGATEAQVPETERQDEIGELARAAEVFRQNALRIEKMNEEQKAATEKMTELNAEREKSAQREIEMAREKEEADQIAAQERAEMMRNLGSSFGEVVNDAIAGKFSSRVASDFADETLIELAQNINMLMEAVDDGLSQTGALLARVAKGDLTERMEGNFQGSFADLQGNVNEMLDSLTTLIGEISESGATLSGSSGELQQTADSLSRQAEQNAASVEETSAALEELSASIKQVSANIAGVSTSAKEARKTASDSEIIAAEAAMSMDRIADGSKEISRVIGVINDISFQINLLALNAGVEAARAGDAGRGFSVVASEVRQLAQRASNAAKEIAEVITQSDTAVAEGVTNVASAKDSLENIAKTVVNISESVDSVTTAISEQSAGISEITSAVTQIDSNTQKQAAAFEEVTASSHVLAKEAQDLRKATSRFQIQEEKNVVQIKKPEPAKQQSAIRAIPEKAVGADAYTGWNEF
ncbi:hypothetical protein ROLI_015890 [Roseobacter fucihabitans]|uniref:Methyl-accepting chemotaxis protein n=2 Tax=Roseobacter fucihabitans TaxID=1537242 RepID=A0ABZ2BS29_9RHOB